MEKLIEILESENKCVLSIDTPVISTFMTFYVESYQICGDGIVISTEDYDDFHIKTQGCLISDPDEDGWIEIRNGNATILISESTED